MAQFCFCGFLRTVHFQFGYVWVLIIVSVEPTPKFPLHALARLGSWLTQVAINERLKTIVHEVITFARLTVSF